MSFIRGTTPTYTIKYPREIQIDTLKDTYITFEQNKANVELTKHGSELVIMEQDNAVKVTLSQEETLKFQKGTFKLQIRSIDYFGHAVATIEAEDEVYDVLYEKVIE